MNLLAEKDISLQTKCSLLEAMDRVLCVQQMPRQALMNEIPKLISVTLRLKREFASPRNRNSPDAAYYQNATEAARQVLEKLGHSEGRDNRKFTMYAMLIVGVGILIGSGINRLLGQ